MTALMFDAPMKTYRWDVRMGSPRKLWRFLDDFLTDTQYTHNPRRELKLEAGAIEGTATFQDVIDAWKDCKGQRDWVSCIAGIILCLSIILIPLGAHLIRKSSGDFRVKLRVIVEGEAYRIREAGQTELRAAEVLDGVADARVELQAWVGRLNSSEYNPIGLDPKHDHLSIEWLGNECAMLKQRIDSLLKTTILPEVTAPVIRGDR